MLLAPMKEMKANQAPNGAKETEQLSKPLIATLCSHQSISAPKSAGFRLRPCIAKAA
jgi:hypothetical protein